MTKSDAREIVNEANNPWDFNFDHDSERDKFLEVYKEAMEVLEYDDDTIEDNITEFENCSTTREDLCINYNCNDDELDDIMEDDIKDLY